MADFRALCAELVDAIDSGISTNRMYLSPVMLRTRAALAHPEPEGVTLDCDEIDVPVWHRGDDFHVYKEGYTAGWAAGAKAAADCYARPTIEPVPVAERPWEREGWCDARGQCWWLKPADFDDNEPVPSWYLDVSPALKEIRFFGLTHSLPHHALPLPTSEGD